jgi:ribosomal protein L22
MTETENDPELTEPERGEADATPEPAAQSAEAKPKRRTRAKAKAADAEPAAEATADAEDDEAEGEAKPRRTRRTRSQGTGKPVAEDATEDDKPRRRTRRKAEPEKRAAPARKKRPAHDWGDNPPMVRAHAKYVRTSARKARLVCDHIRGKDVTEARAILAHANRDVARDWSKLLESAVANAEHNHELIGDELRIAAVKADEGPTLKRFRPRAMGRATKIRKRTSHLSITLTPKDGDK